jgi:hypothetical protein
MKNITDSELIDMAYAEIRKMDVNLWSQMILAILCIAESVLLLFGLIPMSVFAVFWFLFMGLYLFHYKKSKKSEIKIQEILNELTSREV